MNAAVALKYAMRYAESLSYGESKPIQNYNQLNNIPIINIEGSLSNPIVLSELASGIYRISGNYYICNRDDTCHIDASGQTIFFITKESNSVLKINSISIIFYTISGDTYKKSLIPTIDDINEIVVELQKLIPSKTSQLENDSGFITDIDLQKQIENNFCKITNSEIERLF